MFEGKQRFWVGPQVLAHVSNFDPQPYFDMHKEGGDRLGSLLLKLRVHQDPLMRHKLLKQRFLASDF